MKQLRRAALWLLTAALALAALGPAAAQADRARLEIVRVEAGRYPEISLVVRGTDPEGRGLVDLAGIALEEDGRPIDDFAFESGRGGMQVLFVLDANETLDTRDEAGGPTRREKVRDAIIRFANLFMDPTQADQVGIVVPEADGGRFLDQPDMTFPNEVINAINFYDPGELGPTPLNAMLELALDHAAADVADGRFQAIVLLSDAAAIGDQLDYETLLARAEAANVTFYGLLLGGRADAAELANLNRLAEPTIGQVAHMPEPPAADPLFTAIRERATQHLLTYDSRLTGSGEHFVAVELGDARAEAAIELHVEPPTVMLAVDNSQPIRRVAPELDTPLAEMEPRLQPLVAQVGWPDGLPRSLAAAALLVDGVEQPLEAPVLDASGLLTFDWDISDLDAGTYELQVQITDVLDLVGVSPPLPLAIEIDRPEPPPTATPPPAPPAAPDAAESPGLIPGIPNRLLAIGGAALALLLLLALVVGGLLSRRRGRAPAAPPAAPVAPAAPAAALDPEATQVMLPAFAFAHMNAYLEAVENAPEHSQPIPIVGANVPLGRDPHLVQVRFSDRSVSRLHARIIETGGVYRIHDEGSASGTYVNFERVGLTPRILKDNDDLHLGRVRLRFHVTARAEDEDSTQVFAPPTPEEPAGGGDTQVYTPPA